MDSIEAIINEIENLDFVLLFDEQNCEVAFDEAVSIAQMEKVMELMKRYEKQLNERT